MTDPMPEIALIAELPAEPRKALSAQLTLSDEHMEGPAGTTCHRNIAALSCHCHSRRAGHAPGIACGLTGSRTGAVDGGGSRSYRPGSACVPRHPTGAYPRPAYRRRGRSRVRHDLCGAAPYRRSQPLRAQRAADTSQVDAFDRAGLANGGTDDGAPGVRSASPGQPYVVYLRDPDGNKICAMLKAGWKG